MATVQSQIDYSYNCLGIIFKPLAGLQPNYITDMFSLSLDIATRITSSCYTNKLFSPTVWNNLPDSFRNVDTLNALKQTFKYVSFPNDISELGNR